jgi:hypothetical protein
MAFMAAPFMRAARSAPGSAAQAMMRGVTDEDPTVAMPAMRNVTPDNDVPGRGIPQATPVENATGAISRDVPPPAAANDMAQSRPPIVAERPEMQHWGAHVGVVNRKYLAEEGASVEVSKAYTSYRREAVRAGIEPLDQAGFSRMMADAGFEKAQIGGRSRYLGIVMAEQSKGQTAGTAITSAAERATTQNVRSVEDLIKEFKIKRVDESQSPAPPVPREVDDVGYTSQALEAARRLKQDKGTPEQILSQLKKAGVKDAEIDATGLREFMGGKKSVTRAEIVNHLRKNRVDVRQRVLRGEGPPQERYVQTDLPGNYPVRREMGEAAPQPRPDRAKWQEYSVDEYNPTYREIVVHLPQRAKGDDFHQGHFDEPNVVGHLRSSVHDGPDGKQYVVNELQSDWGQKLRKDGGARDEAKIAELKRQAKDLEDASQKKYDEYTRAVMARPSSLSSGQNADIFSQKMFGKNWKDLTDEQRQALAKKAGENHAENHKIWEEYNKLSQEASLREAELRTAEAATPGNPLVNTTDQWVTTMLRKSLMEAVDSDAQYITIASGKTVDGYDMGAPIDGLKYAYDEMYPKKLRDILKKIDPEAAKSMERIATVKASDGEDVGEGFVRFKLTDKVREEVRRGLPLFSKSDNTAANAARSAGERPPLQKALDEADMKPTTPGLDMSEPARLERAKKLGFKTERRLYHGTVGAFPAFDKAKGGSATKAKSGRLATWLVDDPKTASGYADNAADQSVTRLIEKSQQAERRGDWDAAHDFMARAEKLEQEGVTGASVMPLYIKGRLKKYDMDGAQYDPDDINITEMLRQAKSEGYDGAEFVNFSDEAGYGVYNPATHIAVFDPRNIRSTKAAFDPANQDSANLLLSNAAKGGTAANAIKSAEDRKKKGRD